MLFRIILIVFVIPLLLCGCFAYDMDQSMKGWIGFKETELVRSWGPPASIQTKADSTKTKIYLYKDHKGFWSPTFRYNGSRTLTEEFTIDSTSKIIASRWW